MIARAEETPVPTFGYGTFRAARRFLGATSVVLVALCFSWDSLVLTPRALFTRQVPDDAGYYLKTALNAARGLGSTFDGQNPTNGYHPLWFLMLAAMGKVGIPLGMGEAGFLQVATALQVLMFCAAVTMVFTLLLPTDRPFALLAATMLAATCSATVNLLETPVLLLCLSGLLLFLQWDWHAPASAPRVGGAVLLSYLCFLARLDAGVLFLAVACWYVVQRRYRQGIWFCGCAGVVLALHFALYYLIWQQFVPVSGIIKLHETGARVAGFADMVSRLLAVGIHLSLPLSELYSHIYLPGIIAVTAWATWLASAGVRTRQCSVIQPPASQSTVLQQPLPGCGTQAGRAPALVMVVGMYLVGKFTYYTLMNTRHELTSCGWYWAVDHWFILVLSACGITRVLSKIESRLAEKPPGFGSRAVATAPPLVAAFLGIAVVLGYRVLRLHAVDPGARLGDICRLSPPTYLALMAASASCGVLLLRALARSVLDTRLLAIWILILCTSPLLYYAQVQTQISPAFARWVYHDFTATHFDVAELIRGNRGFERYRIGAFNAGILGFFSEVQVTNLDGLINSHHYYETYVRPSKWSVYIAENLDMAIDFYPLTRDRIVLSGFVPIDITPFITNPYINDRPFYLHSDYYLFCRPDLVAPLLEVLRNGARQRAKTEVRARLRSLTSDL
jgi:hypothetical protein